LSAFSASRGFPRKMTQNVVKWLFFMDDAQHGIWKIFGFIREV